MTVPLANVHLVVFDLDGTLVDAFEDIHQATNYALRRLGRPPKDLPAITSYVGDGVRNLMIRALETENPDWVDRGVAFWKEYSKAHVAERARLYPGALALLKTLGGAGMRRAVLTNKADEIATRIMKQLGADNELDLVWGERGEFGVKPDPAALEAMMEFFHVPPDCTLIVGDGEPDIRVAQAAGAWSCGATWGLSPRRMLVKYGADMIVDSLSELRKAFEQALDRPGTA